MTLNQKAVALVTGASAGIGEAIAQKLAKDGYAVALVARTEAKLKALATTIQQAGGDALAVPCDVSKLADITAACQTLRQQWGAPQILVNNAGVGGPFHRVDEVSESEWDWIFDTNVKSVFRFCREFLPSMKSAGFGRIINIASIQGLFGATRSSTYVATKHAMVGYSKAIAAEWGAHGITANAICPGYIMTPMTEPGLSSNTEIHQRLVARIPVGKVGLPEHIADMVSFLAAPHSSYVNGASFVIDGGMTCHQDF